MNLERAKCQLVEAGNDQIRFQKPVARARRFQPLRFLLADEPGAGKTLMASLLIKELIFPERPATLPHRLPILAFAKA
jgi:hypothetical protein